MITIPMILLMGDPGADHQEDVLEKDIVDWQTFGKIPTTHSGDNHQ